MQAVPVHLVQSVKSASSDLQVLLDPVEPLEQPECLGPLASLDQLDSRETVVQRDLLVSLEYRERPVLSAILVFPVSLALLVRRVKLANLDRPDPEVPMDSRVLLEHRAGLAIQGRRDSLELRAILVVLDHLECLETKDGKVCRALLGMSVPKDNQVRYTLLIVDGILLHAFVDFSCVVFVVFLISITYFIVFIALILSICTVKFSYTSH